MTDIEKWADKAMFHAEPQDAWDETTGVQPRVYLIGMNKDPLGDIASMAAMYEGRVIRSYDDLSDDDRRNYFEQISKSHLATPFEAVKFNFLIEGVDRAFTHQIVRKRIGTSFAQESMRFAVPGTLHQTTTIPPSLYGTHYLDEEALEDYAPDQVKMRGLWDATVQFIDEAYHKLVAMGMPAEEARGLLPTAVATRINMNITLNTLFSMAGERLCTQAQFHWRSVMTQMVEAIRKYPNRFLMSDSDNDWQFEYLANSKHFKPVCYQLGRCPWKASFDRGCTIRKRVDRLQAEGISSDHWLNPPQPRVPGSVDIRIEGIRDEEWRLDPYAGVVHTEADRPR